MKNRIKTVILVVLLSCLVWVLAERAGSQEATLKVSLELVNPREDLLLQYLIDNKPRPHDIQHPMESIDVELAVRGPARLIQVVKGKILEPQVIQLDMDKYKPDGQASQSFTLWVSDLLNNRLLYENNYLQVTGSSPSKIDIRVTQMVKRNLPIKVYDQYKVELTAEVNPAVQIAYVIDGQLAEARIDLTAEQQQQARQQPVSLWGQIVLPDNVIWKFQKMVQVRLPESEADWPIKDIKTPRLGILISPRLSQKWQVEINEDALKEYSPIRCRGTAQATKEYMDGEYHLLLEIKENDNKEEILYRPAIYNLPPGCEQPLTIVDPKQIPIPFKLIPVPPAPVAAEPPK